MHPHETLIAGFYEAFNRHDGAAMAACYHPKIVFSDPVFTHLVGPQAGAMWQMLCARAKDLRVEASNIKADDQRGSASWVAHYTFSTGRKVENHISATYDFADGKIIRHTDRFDLWKWTRMALGTPGLLLGWAPPFHATIRRKVMRDLQKWMDAHPTQSEPAAQAS